MAAGCLGEFQPPKPKPKAIEAVFESPQFLMTSLTWSDPADKLGGLPELAAEETEAGAEVATDAEEVRQALVGVRAAILADMVVDADGKVSWWLTQLGADVEVSADTDGTRFLCPRAQCARRKNYYEKGTLFPYSKSIGAFNVGIGCFSIRLAE